MQRVTAVSSISPTEAVVFGDGFHLGSEPCPQMAEMISDDALIESLGEMTPEDLAQAKARYLKNPKIVLDDGSVIWGFQCWWASPDRVAEAIGDRPIRQVPVPEANERIEGWQPPIS